MVKEKGIYKKMTDEERRYERLVNDLEKLERKRARKLRQLIALREKIDKKKGKKINVKS